MTEAYPLHWPAGWPRTSRRAGSRFEPRSLAYEGQAIRWEIDRLGGTGMVVSTNVPLRRDGLPYAGRQKIDDPGVAVYFELAGRQQCIPCDRWHTVEENCRAIWKSIEALRGLERRGAKSFVDAAFRGFEALPAPGAARHWTEVLGVPDSASGEQVDCAYRDRARKLHPDNGGSNEAMAELNRARDEARNVVG